MHYEPSEQDELMLVAIRMPSLDFTVQTWYEARQRFQNEAGKEQRDAYDAAVNQLGQALSVWSAKLPGFHEQLGMWIDSHPRD
jgi:hypothetical protein